MKILKRILFSLFLTSLAATIVGLIGSYLWFALDYSLGKDTYEMFGRATKFFMIVSAPIAFLAAMMDDDLHK